MPVARPQGGEEALRFGSPRIGVGWVGIGIAGFVFVVVAASQLLAGGPESPAIIAAIGGAALLLALLCCITRVVEIDPARREIIVTRRLLGLAWRRRFPFAAFERAAVEWHFHVPRNARRDGTLEGDQRFMGYWLALRGRSRLVLDWTKDPEAAEDAARRLGRILGIRAERCFYVRVPGRDGVMLSESRPRLRTTLPRRAR